MLTSTHTKLSGTLDLIAATHNAAVQKLHPTVELPLVRPYLDKFDKARSLFSLFIYIHLCGHASVFTFFSP
jgi:hypothetical protein